MKKRINKTVYYARLVVMQNTDKVFLNPIKVNLDYDLYNSFKKLPTGDYYLNDKNKKLIEKTLNRFKKQALETDNLCIDFHIDDLGIGFNTCECGAKHVMICDVICDGASFPEDKYLILGLLFTNDEMCQ